jgi:SAM-dependent methyltransferase
LNRVFSQALGSLAAAELQIVTNAFTPEVPGVGDLTVTDFGRATGLRFAGTWPEARLASTIGSLSCALALFAEEPKPDSDPWLRPIPLRETLTYGTELATTQRYRGKTNERLTRAMLNIGLAGAGLSPNGPWESTPTVLDPMCGRGTTLNWALAYGLNTIGIEPDAGALRHYDTFLTTWAKRSRLPHKHQSFRANNAEHRHATFEVAVDRRSQKAGQIQRVETFTADGGDASLRIRGRSVDVIVADLPYGVQHRTSDPAKFNPPKSIDLIERLAPTWRQWLRPGGSVCLAWNVKRASRGAMLAALTRSGFEPPSISSDFSMEHHVDASITRDVLLVV